MRSRKEILNDIILAKGNLSILESEILNYSWDSDEEIVFITSTILNLILKKHLDGELDKYKLIDWANLIECREDIGYQSEIHKEIIHDISNSEMNNYGILRRFQSEIENLE